MHTLTVLRSVIHMFLTLFQPPAHLYELHVPAWLVRGCRADLQDTHNTTSKRVHGM